MLAESRQSAHGQWSSKFAFILAATGAAVGLGNIWKFPYITGENGGGAFVVIYIFCTLLVGIPLLMAEIMLGRCGRQNPANSMQTIATEAGRSRSWGLVGGMTVIAGPLILSYYSVIAGWAVAYTLKAASGVFAHADANKTLSVFQQFVANPWQLSFWHSFVMLGTLLVIARGLEHGIERAVTYLFPGMLLLLVALVLYGMQSGYFHETLVFLFAPDWAELQPKVILVAMGQAFFSLSVANGSIMMYGAYLPRTASVTSAAIAIALADLGVALIAGLAIFPVVFANHMTPSAGPGLVFETLPIAFGKMPMGSLFAALFFLMLVFAAFTSAISLLEPPVAWLIEVKHFTRKQAATIAALAVWLLGFGTVFAFNGLADYRLWGLNFFELLDYLTANIMLPVGGLLIGVFAVWRLDKTFLCRELQLNQGLLFSSWRFTLRYITPVLITAVFLRFLGVI